MHGQDLIHTRVDARLRKQNHAKSCLVAAGSDALLVVASGLIVGVDDGVRGDAVGVVRLSPGVDGVDVGDGVEHGAEKGEHFLKQRKRKGQTLLTAECTRRIAQPIQVDMHTWPVPKNTCETPRVSGQTVLGAIQRLDGR